MRVCGSIYSNEDENNDAGKDGNQGEDEDEHGLSEMNREIPLPAEKKGGSNEIPDIVRVRVRRCCGGV